MNALGLVVVVCIVRNRCFLVVIGDFVANLDIVVLFIVVFVIPAIFVVILDVVIVNPDDVIDIVDALSSLPTFYRHFRRCYRHSRRYCRNSNRFCGLDFTIYCFKLYFLILLNVVTIYILSDVRSR